MLAIAWTWPLAAHLTTHLPGAVAGDNIDFLWNVWWMRQALQRPELSFFYTDRLFAPYGIDLTLHTHAALPSLVAALMSTASAITAQNIVILASLALNGWAAYLLAFDRTRDYASSMLAGLVFAGSPYVSTRLLGHFNLIGLWGLPLFLLFLMRARERGSVAAAIGAGITAVAIAYTDYYYLVYCALVTAAVMLGALSRVRVVWRRTTPSALARRAVMVLLLLDLALIVAILTTGGFAAVIGGTDIVARRITNPLAIAWTLLAVLVLLHVRPAFADRRVMAHDRALLVRVGAVLFVVVLAGVAPLAARGWSMLRAGDYTAPPASWRSGPGGIDLATLLLGNPQHPATGAWTRIAYDTLGIDRMESAGWLGVAPIAFLIAAIIIYRRDREVRLWLVIGASAFIWALGPWLRVASFDTGLFLPQNLAAHVPVLSNARIPGRAMALVYLALAMLVACVGSRVSNRRRLPILFAAAFACVVDYLPAPFPLTSLKIPVVYADIFAAGGDAAVFELPAGVRDGLGSFGRFDDRVLLYQMAHGHPIVGGFAARVPQRIKDGYAQTPVIRSLFRLSAGEPIDPRDRPATRADAFAALSAAKVGYVMLNRETAPPPLVAFVERTLPLVLVRSDGPHDLFIVSADAATAAPPSR